MQFNPNVLVGRWTIAFEDGKRGWLQLGPRNEYGNMPGHMFIPNSVIDYPPSGKRTGRDYDNDVGLAIGDPATIGANMYSLVHWKSANAGTGMFHMGLVADGVMSATTLICENGGKIMHYPGTGYPFQFMGSGDFIATRV